MNELEYWKNRCLSAERFIDESPCDPDITVRQMDAYQQWNRAKDFGTLMCAIYIPKINTEEGQPK